MRDGHQPAAVVRHRQRHIDWRASGEWNQHPSLALRSSQHYIGDQAKGNSVLLTLVYYEPGAEVPAHFHLVDYASLVLEGSIEITRRDETLGALRLVDAGTGYGPLRAGPTGCTVLDIFALGDLGSEAIKAQYFQQKGGDKSDTTGTE